MNYDEIDLLVKFSTKKGRADFTVLKDKPDITNKQMRGILAGAISLLIKCEKTNAEQALAIEQVIDLLQMTFVDSDSFSDAESFARLK